MPLEINSRGRNRAEGIQNKAERDTHQTKTICSCQTSAMLSRSEHKDRVHRLRSRSPDEQQGANPSADLFILDATGRPREILTSLFRETPGRRERERERGLKALHRSSQVHLMY